ncbi:MAG: ROK family protein [Chloroflexi bacterium]|nr:ROK family protein [Chloroflexota bacterium]
MTRVRPEAFGAIDLGGTKILSIVATADGHILGEDLRPSRTADGLEAVMRYMVYSLDAALNSAGRQRQELPAVGIASPGAVDAVNGIVPDAPQLPGWRDVPLRDLMAEELGLRVFLENDASAAALGEHVFGAGRGSRYMLFLTISTGVGGGIIIDGKLYGGKSGAAGELGHFVIDADGPPCGCGARGCLESLASGSAIARRGRELLARGQSPGLARLAEAEGDVTTEMMYRAAADGDEGCREAFRQAGRYLGIALAGYVNVFDPEVIIIGGGVAQAGELLLEPARQAMEELAMTQPLRGVRLVAGELGKGAGALGMVAVMRGQLQKEPVNT